MFPIVRGTQIYVYKCSPCVRADVSKMIPQHHRMYVSRIIIRHSHTCWSLYQYFSHRRHPQLPLTLYIVGVSLNCFVGLNIFVYK